MNQTTNNTIYGLDVKTTIDNTTFLILNIAFEPFFKPLPRHSHGNNSYELHYIPNGLGQAVIDGSSYELTPGTLYMTGPHVEHEQIPSPMDPMTEYSIYFQLQEEDTRFFRQHCGQISEKKILDWSGYPESWCTDGAALL